jgi:hypothetical protein
MVNTPLERSGITGCYSIYSRVPLTHAPEMDARNVVGYYQPGHKYPDDSKSSIFYISMESFLVAMFLLSLPSSAADKQRSRPWGRKCHTPIGMDIANPGL